MNKLKYLVPLLSGLLCSCYQAGHRDDRPERIQYAQFSQIHGNRFRLQLPVVEPAQINPGIIRQAEIEKSPGGRNVILDKVLRDSSFYYYVFDIDHVEDIYLIYVSDDNKRIRYVFTYSDS